MNTKPDQEDENVFEASTPKFVRLNTGEDLVCELTEVNDEEDCTLYYYIHNPIKLVYVPSPNPSMYGVAMTQWVSQTICHEQVFTLNGDSIVTVSNVTDYITRMYYKAVSHYNHMAPQDHGADPNDDDEELEQALEEMEAMSMIDNGQKSSKTKKKMIH